jgi:peptidoglycan/xylan/chitin deacetylase (PgdA/CDA1 family)
VLGYKARKYPDVVRAIHAGGHCIGVHGDVHDRLHSFRMPLRVRDEILRAKRAVSDIIGIEPRLFRPPIGHTTPATMLGARLAKVTLIGWSARGYDGLRRSQPAAVVQRVSRSLSDGAIVLLHDASERDDFEPASLRALPELFLELDGRGLLSVPLDSWLL